MELPKQIALCGDCAAKLAEGYKLTQLPRPANDKITCAHCGHRRYGATYMVSRKEAAAK